MLEICFREPTEHDLNGEVLSCFTIVRSTYLIIIPCEKMSSLKQREHAGTLTCSSSGILEYREYTTQWTRIISVSL